METCSESVNEIPWCDHSKETSSAVLLHSTIRFQIICEIKFGIFVHYVEDKALAVNEQQ